MKYLCAGIYAEGPTDERFLCQLVDRLLYDIAFDVCPDQFEIGCSSLHFANSSGVSVQQSKWPQAYQHDSQKIVSTPKYVPAGETVVLTRAVVVELAGALPKDRALAEEPNAKAAGRRKR